jgi:hypothetical protein
VPYLEIYDDDQVDGVNLPTQLHKISDLGRAKVEALADLIREFSDETDLILGTTRVDAQTALRSQFIVSAVDSIAARKSIWEAVKRGACQWYLDARMGAETFHLHVVDMQEPEASAWYEQLLAGEDEADVPDLPCTAKATFYTAAIAAGHIGNAVKRLHAGQHVPRMIIHDIQAFSLVAIK